MGDPLDFTSLDPDGDPVAEERFVRAVMARVDASRRRDQVAADPYTVIVALAPRALAAAGLVITLGGGALLLPRITRGGTAPESVAEAIGIPPTIARQIAARTVWTAPATGAPGGQP